MGALAPYRGAGTDYGAAAATICINVVARESGDRTPWATRTERPEHGVAFEPLNGSGHIGFE